MRGGRTLVEIEAAARELKAGLWRDWVPPVAAPKQVENESPSEEVLRVGVTESSPAVVSRAETRGSKIDEVTKKLAELYDGEDATKPFDGVFEPKPGDAVAAKYTGDDKWSRAIVTERRVGDKPVGVFYCDFGNCEEVPFCRLRPLKDASVTTTTIPPMANFCALSYLKIPRIDSDYGYQAATCVGDLLSGRVFYAKIDARDRSPTTKPWQADAPPTFTVTLFRDEDTTESIAIDVLKAGFARVDVRAASRRLANRSSTTCSTPRNSPVAPTTACGSTATSIRTTNTNTSLSHRVIAFISPLRASPRLRARPVPPRVWANLSIERADRSRASPHTTTLARVHRASRHVTTTERTLAPARREHVDGGDDDASRVRATAGLARAAIERRTTRARRARRVETRASSETSIC